jgi:hypothetical protein
VVVKLVGRYARGVVGRALKPALPWIDLLMMRQLLNLKRLAEGMQMPPNGSPGSPEERARQDSNL